MHRLKLEQHQVWIYLVAILAGLLVGMAAPYVAPTFDTLLWPILAALLYTTFVQIPLLHARRAMRDIRFVFAIFLGNFVLIPILVWLSLNLLPDDPALQLGVLLVLLVPCTDWFIAFSQLGHGSTARAIAITPFNLFLQLLLLPGYLWLMLPAAEFSTPINTIETLPAAVALIGVPLVAALITQRWVDAQQKRQALMERLGWWPVPLLSLVVFLIAGAQADTVLDAGPLMLTVLPLFVGFLLAAALVARGLAVWLKLPTDAGRTLAFSLGTRNSFVVLPLAVALPAGWETTVVVIVFQSLVELFGMAFYLWWLPRYLFKVTP